MENLEQYKLNKNILCIDLKSFYASVECVLRGLDPYKTPLVVADKSRGDAAIVLAVTPYLKAKGIPSRLRVFELPKNIDIIYARPSMKTYMEYSALVVGIYLNYISDDDLYVYSIDEAFLDVTNYLKMYNKTDYELAKEILGKIEEKLGLTATCGIGPNMLIAKLAMDIEAKKKNNNIAKWGYDNLEEKLWNVEPLSKMWSIGSRYEKKLNLMGLTKIGDIAKYDPKKLKQKFGILGEELWYHTNGIDLSLVQDKHKIRSKPKSFGISQVLFRNYNEKEILTIFLEMIDEVTRRLRISKKSAKTISLGISYSKEFEGGFYRQVTLDSPTNSETTIYNEVVNLFDMYYEGYPIKKVAVSLSSLTDQNIYQYSIFEDGEKILKEKQLQSSVDKIKFKYGKNSITRAVSEEEHSTAKDRNNQIGGHHV